MSVSTAVLDRLRGERDQCRDAAIAMAEADDFDPSSDAYGSLEERATSLDNQIEHLVNLINSREAADALDGRLSRAAQRQDETRQAPQTRQSWGEAFIRSDAFTSYSRHGQSMKFEVDDAQTRALPTGLVELVAAGIKGSILSVDTTAPTPPTPLLDSVTTVNVSGNSVEYVSWAKIAGSAATVAEKGPKPSVEFGPTVTPATLEMIAAYTQLTRQMIEDAPAVRSLIDGELRREIAREEEEHAATAIAAATLPAFTGAAGTGLVGAVRGGIGTVQAAGYSPNAVLLNPADYAEMDITVMGATLLGPSIGSQFWGLTPIAANSQPAGTATVGDFRTAINFFVRSQISLFLTDSHSDTFLSNVFTLLAERRSKTAVVRPQALVECVEGGA